MLQKISKHWEQVFFGVVGLVFLTFSFVALWAGDVAGASATFAMAFFSFFYANIARFKRFKGLGFEAELWEDTQKEAEHLIDRLKAVVSIYTREIVMARVQQGRWGNGSDWNEHWRVYHELVERHSELGQKIDFTELKKNMDEYFLFDITGFPYREIQKSISDGRAEARGIIEAEFGSPIKDAVGYARRHKQLAAITDQLEDRLKKSHKGDLAAQIIQWGKSGQKKLEEDFSVKVEFDTNSVELLEKISRLYQTGLIEVTDELILLATKK